MRPRSQAADRKVQGMMPDRHGVRPDGRLLATGVLSAEPGEGLQALYEQTNPLTLRHEIYQRFTELWNGATSQAGMAV